MMASRILSATRLAVPPQHLARARVAAARLRRFSSSPAAHQPVTVRVRGQGTGTTQTLSVGDKHQFQSDTYATLGGRDSAPSPVAYSLASLGACNQVTGSLVARDHGVRLGRWDVSVEGVLPTEVLVQGKPGNPNWESVALRVRVQTDIEGGSEAARFRHFAAEVDRRCPITQLFKLSGVQVTSEWVNERL